MTNVPETESPPCAARAERTKAGWFRIASVLLTLFVVGSTALFLVQNRGEIRQAAHGVAGADARWVVFALLLQIVAVALIAVKYRLLLRRLGYRLPATATGRIQVRRHALSSVLPFGGASSLVIFARDLGGHGVTAEDAVFTAGLSSLVSEVAFAAFLLPVLAALVVTGEATGPMLVGSLLLLGLTTSLVVVVLLVCRSRPPARVARRVPGKLVGIMERAGSHGLRTRDLALPVALNLGVNAVGVVTLFACCRAIGATPSLWAIVVGRMIGSVFMLVAPFMQGAGAVELSVTATLRKAGVPTALALASVMMFRVAQFWFPLAMGAVVSVRADHVAVVVRRRVGLVVTGAAVSATAIAVALLATRPDLDRPTLQDEQGIFWVLVLAVTMLFAWVACVGSVGRLRRAFARQRIE
ncbi:MAG TPA: lysylphosphatidylglycerol synthase transmembrane domain-containing protein [Thermomicrobiales bacterium]|jgi:phosphatidylglycerol lysyltransferase